jgi:hypothetical protein
LNYPNEPDEWVRVSDAIDKTAYSYKRAASNVSLSLDQIINYATPGYATAVLVLHRASNAFARQPKAIGGSLSSKSWGDGPATLRWAQRTASRT